MKKFIADRDWLTVIQLPAYAPQLNPVEGIWSLICRDLANTAFTDSEHPITAARRALREIQYRPRLIDGVLTGTGLAGNAGADQPYPFPIRNSPSISGHERLGACT